jgi:uncharacterized protein (TIGR03437 family)
MLLSGLASGPLKAQQYVVSTLAGGAPYPTPAPALSIPVIPVGIAVDPTGNVYFASHLSVFKRDSSGTVTRIAGNGRSNYSGDGGPALEAGMNPIGLALDGAGNLFVVDAGYRIRRIAPSGIITTVAGSGSGCYNYLQGACSLGEGGPALSAPITVWTGAITADSAGSLYLPDSANSLVRKVSTNGIITTVAGNGKRGYSGDTLPATSASLQYPNGLAMDESGNLFIADGAYVRKVDSHGIITTVAGSAGSCSSQSCLGDGGQATNAKIQAAGVAVDHSGNLYIADNLSRRVRQVTPDGMITTVVGSGAVNQSSAFSGDGGPAINAQLGYLQSVTLDNQGNLYIGDGGNGRIRKVTADGMINTVLGNGSLNCCFSGDGGPAASAQLNFPSDIALDRAGNLYIVDTGNGRIRRVSADGTITTVAGTVGQCYSQGCPPLGDGGPAKNAYFAWPWGIALDGAGSLFIADPGADRIRKITPDGIINTVAGTGKYGHSGDNGPAANAQLMSPARVTVDGAGNILVTESLYVRKIASDGTITTIAGNGSYAFSGDGDQATNAGLDTFDEGGCDGPGGGIALDGAGDVLVADTEHNRVREFTPGGAIYTVAGGGSVQYPANGDGGAASNSTMYPFDVVYDQAGNLLVADSAGPRVRRITPGGTITSIAGSGAYGYSGDGGAANTATFSILTGIRVDGAGNIYVADQYNNAIRVLRPTNYSLLINAVVDAATQRAAPVSAGKIVTIYGSGLGPAKATTDSNSGTSVLFNGQGAQVLYTSMTQVSAIVPGSISGTSAQVTVSYQGQVSNGITVPVAVSSPGLFTLNQTGSGQAVARHADGSLNTAANPAKIGDSITFYATGQGALTADSCGRLPVGVLIGGMAATVLCPDQAVSSPPGVALLKVQIPGGVKPGGYVPVVLQVGNASSTGDAVWISLGN